MPGKKPEKETTQEIKVRELVTERREIEVRLRESEKKYRDLIMYLPVGVYRSTPGGEIIEANEHLVSLLGYDDLNDIKAVNARELYADELDRLKHMEKLDECDVCFSEFRLKRKDGSVIWGRDYPRAVKDPSGQVIYYDGILVDITEQRESEMRLQEALEELEKSNKDRQTMIKRLETLSLLDDLTGLYNRRGFYAAARNEFKHSDQGGNRLFLLYLDLDHLKKINDTWGHRAGDQALVQFVEILTATFRKSDIKGRMGGDEFAVIARESVPNLAERLLERMNENLKELNKTKKYPFTLSMSSGSALYDPSRPVSIDDLLTEADAWMYKHKNSKK